jgi:hypothetical protein
MASWRMQYQAQLGSICVQPALGWESGDMVNCYESTNSAPSFNGRTADSGSAYRGSNPWGAAKLTSSATSLCTASEIPSSASLLCVCGLFASCRHFSRSAVQRVVDASHIFTRNRMAIDIDCDLDASVSHLLPDVCRRDAVKAPLQSQPKCASRTLS